MASISEEEGGNGREGIGNYLIQVIIEEDWEYFETKSYRDIRANASVWAKVPCFIDCRGPTDVLPLHVAAATNTPFRIFDMILRAYPEAISERESGFGRLPLHISCRSDCSLEAIKILLWHYPEAAHTPDRLGRLPLHYAIRFNSGEDVVRALLSINPLAPQYYDKPGWLPIHMACQGGSSASVIKLLIDAFPASINAKTATGITPMSIMHISRKRGPNYYQVMRLLQGATDFIDNDHNDNNTKKEKISQESLDGRRTPPPLERNSRSIPSIILLTPDSKSTSTPHLLAKHESPMCVSNLQCHY